MLGKYLTPLTVQRLGGGLPRSVRVGGRALPSGSQRGCRRPTPSASGRRPTRRTQLRYYLIQLAPGDVAAVDPVLGVDQVPARGRAVVQSFKPLLPPPSPPSRHRASAALDVGLEQSPTLFRSRAVAFESLKTSRSLSRRHGRGRSRARGIPRIFRVYAADAAAVASALDVEPTLAGEELIGSDARCLPLVDPVDRYGTTS